MTGELLINNAPEGHSYWVFIALVMACIVAANITGLYREQSQKILVASINERTKGSLNRTDSDTISKVSKYLNIFFFINLLLFVYALVYRYKLLDKYNTIHLYQIFGGVILVFLVKFLIHLFIGTLFKTEEYAKLYLQDSYLKYKLFGVFIFPLILLILFSTKLANLAAGLGIAGFFTVWILKSYFGLKLGLLSKSFPKHYSFVYICTLEILPLVIAGKILKEPIATILGL
tara:strand:+ start:68 stop:760 length:693 start_codon:yes stop_codon:yes gene_type:complete